MKAFLTTPGEPLEIEHFLISHPSMSDLGKLNLWINQQEGSSVKNRWSILPSNRLLTLYEKKRCLGLVAFSLFKRREGSWEIKIQMVWTHPRYRNLGLGGVLVADLAQSIAVEEPEISEILLTGSAKSSGGERWLSRMALFLGKKFRVIQMTDSDEDEVIPIDPGCFHCGREEGDDFPPHSKPRRKK